MKEMNAIVIITVRQIGQRVVQYNIPFMQCDERAKTHATHAPIEDGMASGGHIC